MAIKLLHLRNSSDMLFIIRGDIMQTELVSMLVNALLLIITGCTVYYASRTLSIENSSQVSISSIKEKINRKEKFPISYEVRIRNYGKGYIVRGFTLITLTSKN